MGITGWIQNLYSRHSSKYSMRMRHWYLLVHLGLAALRLSGESVDLLGATGGEFEEHWERRGFPLISPTEYRASVIDGGVVVNGSADDANRGLARRGEVADPTTIKLSWAWRVRSKLTGAFDERTKAGDDFAARVFVIFTTSVIPTRTEAINYVWAAREPVGAVFPSPYTDKVAHIVLRTAGHQSNEDWQDESRDVFADYVAYFGKKPDVVTAVAIMVDTDNTDGQAEADFRNLILEIEPPPKDSSPDVSP